MSRVLADPAELERVARHLEAASGEFCRVARRVGGAGASLSGPLALSVQDVTEPVARALMAEAQEIAVLAGELRLVSQAIQRALAGGIEPRLAVDGRRWLEDARRLGDSAPPPGVWPSPLLSGDAIAWRAGVPGLRGRSGVRGLARYLQSVAGPRVTGKPPGNPTAAIGVGLALLLLAMIAFSQLPKGGSDAGDAQQKLEDFRRQQKRKAVAVALAGAPNPPPDPKDEKEIERSVRELGVDKARFESLARDPAIGWRIDESTIEEARIALRLEGKCQLHDVVRSPDPAVDLIEDGGAGRSWDVKSYRAEGFDLTRTLAAINDELQAGHRVIINTAHLSRAQVIQLEKFVDLQPWGGRILFATSE